jgi:hypothetical protein
VSSTHYPGDHGRVEAALAEAREMLWAVACMPPLFGGGSGPIRPATCASVIW